MTEEQNLEKKLENPLELGDLAIQVSAFDSKDGYNPNYIEMALENYFSVVKDKEKFSINDYIAKKTLIKAHRDGIANKLQGGNYIVNDILDLYMHVMANCFDEKFENSTLGELNNALAKYGVSNKFANEALTIKELRKKAQKGSDEEKQAAMNILSFKGRLLSLSKNYLDLQVSNKAIEEANKIYKKPEERTREIESEKSREESEEYKEAA